MVLKNGSHISCDAMRGSWEVYKHHSSSTSPRLSSLQMLVSWIAIKYNECPHYYQIQGKFVCKTGGADLLDVTGETVFVFYFKTCLPLSQRMESPLKL